MACTVPGTGGRQNRTSVTCPASGATGIRDLYLRFAGSSSDVRVHHQR